MSASDMRAALAAPSTPGAAPRRPGSLVVIGGGVGGYTAAIRAARSGMSVTLVEAVELGGTCLNVGCIPTKSLLHQAHMFRHAQAWGVAGKGADKLRVDYGAVSARKSQVVRQLVGGVRTLVDRNGIRLIQGTAEFVDARTLLIRETGERITGDHFVIATGSEPVVPRRPGLDGEGVVTSDGALAWTSLPQRILVLGGGVIGVEFAQVFSDFDSEVLIVEQRDALLPQEEPELVRVLQQQLTSGGVKLRLGCRLESVRRTGNGLEATVVDGNGRSAHAADAVLVAIGRRPRLTGLEKLGLELESGAVATDDYCRTSIPNIYAVGDVRGRPLLAHKAAAEAECAIVHLLGHGRPISASVIPRAVYTSPELAVVGLIETEARARFGSVKVGRFPFSASGKALAMGDATGFVKVIASAVHDQVLGVSMVGPDVTNLLGEARLAVPDGREPVRHLRPAGRLATDHRGQPGRCSHRSDAYPR